MTLSSCFQEAYWLEQYSWALFKVRKLQSGELLHFLNCIILDLSPGHVPHALYRLREVPPSVPHRHVAHHALHDQGRNNGGAHFTWSQTKATIVTFNRCLVEPRESNNNRPYLPPPDKKMVLPLRLFNAAPL